MFRNLLIVAGISVLTLATSCGSGKRKLNIGGGTSTEQRVLSEIMSQHISSKMGVDVFVRDGLGTTATVQQALMVNEVDLYVDTIGGLSSVVLREAADQDLTIAKERVGNELDRTAHVRLLYVFQADNPFALVMKKQEAEEKKIAKISDAIEYKPGWNISMTSDFQSRQDGNFAMQTAYSLPLKTVPVTRPPEESYKLLKEGFLNMIVLATIDGRTADPDLVIIPDDKKAFEPANIVAVARKDIDQNFPELKGALAQLDSKLTVEALRKLMAEIDLKHRQPKEVVSEFLAK